MVERNATCLHRNATITFYEVSAKDHKLQEGEVVDSDDDHAPEPLKKVDVKCPDCPLSETYMDWHRAPEPIRTYCLRIYQQEYSPVLTPPLFLASLDIDL